MQQSLVQGSIIVIFGEWGLVDLGIRYARYCMISLWKQPVYSGHVRNFYYSLVVKVAANNSSL